MRVQTTYWVHIKRAFAQLFGCDATVLAQLNELVDAIIAAPRSEQHQSTSKLLGILGGLPNAQELSFLFGAQIPITAFSGDLALGFKIAPTFGDALRLVAKFHDREIPLVRYSYQETTTEGRFSIGFRCPIDSQGEALLVAAATSLIASELSRMTGGGNLKKVELTPSSSGWESTYRKHVSVIPDMDRSSNTIVFDRAALDLPNPTADRDMFEGIVSEYERQAVLQDAVTSLSAKIRELVMSSIAKPPSLESLAKSLHLTRRQLRLMLARESTGYQEVVRSCRVEYASALFRNSALSISQVAYRLGYSDLAAFTHSFTRWTGKSPSRFRIEMLL